MLFIVVDDETAWLSFVCSCDLC